MEFHNAALLPKGLHEIIAAFVPYDIYPYTKVIAYRRKGMGSIHCIEHKVMRGYAGYESLVDSFVIGLYPSVCCSDGPRGIRGTLSFNLWMAMLRTALHEIGHLVTHELCSDLPHDPVHNPAAYTYVEQLADDWMESAMAQILRVDPRLGQPLSALTGYPGALTYRIRNRWRSGGERLPRAGMVDWRGLGCGGQITIAAIVALFLHEEPDVLYEMDECARQGDFEGRKRIESNAKAKIRRRVHRAAKALGIERHFTNRNGYRYLMFDVGEAQAVCDWLLIHSGGHRGGEKDRKRRKKGAPRPPIWEAIAAGKG